MNHSLQTQHGSHALVSDLRNHYMDLLESGDRLRFYGNTKHVRRLKIARRRLIRRIWRMSINEAMKDL